MQFVGWCVWRRQNKQWNGETKAEASKVDRIFIMSMMREGVGKNVVITEGYNQTAKLGMVLGAEIW